MPAFLFEPGTSPLLVSMPHVGTHIPDALAAEMTEAAQGVPDTDWHVDRLYDFRRARRLGAAGYPFALCHRPQPAARRRPLSRARATPACARPQFDDRPLYRPGEAPGGGRDGRAARGYLAALPRSPRGRTRRLRARHGIALLFDAHSIRSRVPRFFEAGSGPQSRHRRRARGGSGPGARPLTAARRRGGGLYEHPQRPLQRRLHHPPLRPAGGADRGAATGTFPDRLYGGGAAFHTTSVSSSRPRRFRSFSSAAIG